MVWDIEATGTDPEIYDCCQIGAVKMCASCFTIYDKFEIMLCPTSSRVDERAMAVHQIPMEQLLKAPPANEALTAFGAWLGEKPREFMPVTWSGWDQAFMRVIYRKLGMKYPLTGKQIDAKSIALHEIAKSKSRYPKGGLGLISVSLGMPAFEQHNALQDAIRTAEILRHFSVIRRCKKHPKPVLKAV